ncbi:hypothetical protein ACJX0J_030323 [Zea mays]
MILEVARESLVDVLYLVYILGFMVNDRKKRSKVSMVFASLWHLISLPKPTLVIESSNNINIITTHSLPHGCTIVLDILPSELKLHAQALRPIYNITTYPKSSLTGQPQGHKHKKHYIKH